MIWREVGWEGVRLRGVSVVQLVPSCLLSRAKHNGEKTVAGDGIDIKSTSEARSRELLTEIWKVYA